MNSDTSIYANMNPLVIVVIVIALVAGYIWYSYSHSVQAVYVKSQDPPPPPVQYASSGDFTSLPIDCGSGLVEINSAMYQPTDPTDACAGLDARMDVAVLCNGRSKCSINVLPTSMTMADGSAGNLASDPCPGIPKKLNIAYQCR